MYMNCQYPFNNQLNRLGKNYITKLNALTGLKHSMVSLCLGNFDNNM